MVELVLRVPVAWVDAASDVLLDELGALAASIEDGEVESTHALFGEPGLPAPAPGWPQSTVKALFNGADEATRAAALLVAQFGSDAVQLKSIEELPDQDWVRTTQAQFEPVPITPSFWIVPSWHRPPPQATRTLHLDPGLAFGTGTHPTTRLCLRWIAHHAPQRAPSWQRVLDYGCGSGILAIAAALHGARSIDAVDIDPAAVAATQANARSNGVLAQVHAGLPEVARGAYALVLANILAQPLKLLAPLLCGHVAAGGDLLLAGMLERQCEELQVAYAPWCRLEVAARDDGWLLMAARRETASARAMA